MPHDDPPPGSAGSAGANGDQLPEPATLETEVRRIGDRLTRAVQSALNRKLDPAGAHAADRDGPTVPRDDLHRLLSHLRELSEQLLKIVSLL